MDEIIRNLKRGLKAGDNGCGDAFKPLWRQSRGSLSKAREIAKAVYFHYTDDKTVDDRDFNEAFDIVCGELFGNGTEIEWLAD